MNELIKELEYNQKINLERGLPNLVAIDYIIERLKEIDPIKQYITNEINYNIESLVNENYMEQDEELKKLENLTDKDIENITELIYNQDWLWDIINENMNEAIESELYRYINNK